MITKDNDGDRINLLYSLNNAHQLYLSRVSRSIRAQVELSREDRSESIDRVEANWRRIDRQLRLDRFRGLNQTQYYCNKHHGSKSNSVLLQ